MMISVFPFPECYINQIWLLSLNLRLLRISILFHILVFFFPFLLQSGILLYESGGPVGRFQYLLIKNKLVINICMQVFAWIQT